MFMFKKNQIIITSLVVMIAAAGYLNYLDSTGQGVNQVMFIDGEDTEGILPVDTADVIAPDDNIEIAGVTETTTINSAGLGSVGEVEPVEAEEVAAGTAVFVSSGDESSYFIQAKLDREQSRAKQKDLLNEMINNDKLDGSKKSDAADQMLEIQKRIEKETAAEAMIEAKGFKEAYVRIDDDTVDVVVDRASLSESEIAKIEDIVKRKTGVSAEKIRISPLRQGNTETTSTTG